MLQSYDTISIWLRRLRRDEDPEVGVTISLKKIEVSLISTLPCPFSKYSKKRLHLK